MNRIIHVRPGASRTSATYDVTVHSGVLRRLPALLTRAWTGRTIFVVTDSRVARLYGRRFRLGLERAGARAILLEFPAGESSKNAATAANLWTAMLLQRIRRTDVVAVIGGGVAGDLGGFVAATILRGVEFVQIPTTLLSQVDSSVGGKVGIDHAPGKNLVGAFHQPSAVYIDPLVLRSLPARHYRNGIAEVVKIAAALDAGFFRWIERNTEAIRRRSAASATEMIVRAIGLKAAVVEKDTLDQGLRNVLNLGHTLGHAVEAASGYRLLHGEAVSIGMVLESEIACRMGLLRPADADRLARALSELGLPTVLPGGLDRASLLSALALDKKGGASGVRYVLLRAIGKSAIGVPVEAQMVDEVLSR